MTDTRKGPGALGTEALPDVLTGVSPKGSSVAEQVTEPDPWASIPKLGAYRTADHRYFWNGQGPVPSVTTVLKVLNKDAVIEWAKRTVAEIAVLRIPELQDKIIQEGTLSAIAWLKSMPDYQRDSAAQLGSSVHLLADMASRAPESDSETFEVSEQEKPYLDAFRDFLTFLERHSGVIVSGEKMVWSTEGYAGTYDLLIRFSCECHKGLWLIDVKTSKGYYPDYALQLVAYGRSDFIIIEGNPTPYPMPKVQKYGVLHLRPDQYSDTGWRLIQYPITDRDYLAFLAALELHKWKTEGRFTKRELKAVSEGDFNKVIRDPLTTELAEAE